MRGTRTATTVMSTPRAAMSAASFIRAYVPRGTWTSETASASVAEASASPYVVTGRQRSRPLRQNDEGRFERAHVWPSLPLPSPRHRCAWARRLCRRVSRFTLRRTRTHLLPGIHAEDHGAGVPAALIQPNGIVDEMTGLLHGVHRTLKEVVC